ncbi:MAG: Dam family site-specific DNA-(adenine-N6)-methyltransferase [SAR324 cluster bacterium]|nr:Dam family site-specific DNA-(adenine-N6)-methyltransferase [SAR324 cluster bacterium]
MQKIGLKNKEQENTGKKKDSVFPRSSKVKVPPIKSQGIKTKLVPWIESLLPEDFSGVWIEPFMGTGVVAFNLAPDQALLCDSNPHLIHFYQAIAEGDITPEKVRTFLNKEGVLLLEKGEAHYYEVRERFNRTHQALDFLFLNRAGFNGMIRFNSKGEFNIPFCRKAHRYAQSYVTKIVNQTAEIERVLKARSFNFRSQDFVKSIAKAKASDIIYCDPPYIGRHVDFYNGWTETQEKQLFEALSRSPAQFILSTWHHNDFRENSYLQSLWHPFRIMTREHFYHVGGNVRNRNPMVEALVTSF